MLLDDMKVRIEQLRLAIEQSVLNHNVLLGQYKEAQEIFNLMSASNQDEGGSS
jgi:hypothetical protein